MKKNPSISLILTSFLAFMTAGCVTLGLSSEYAPLVGDWRHVDSSGSTLISFKKNKTYLVDLREDGSVDFSGDVSVWHNRVTYREQIGGDPMGCREAGYYNFIIKDDQLTQIQIADQCKTRIEAFDGTFQKVNLAKERKDAMREMRRKKAMEERAAREAARKAKMEEKAAREAARKANKKK